MARLPPQKTKKLGDHQIKYIIKSNCRATWFALKWYGPTTEQIFLSTRFATRFLTQQVTLAFLSTTAFPISRHTLSFRIMQCVQFAS